MTWILVLAAFSSLAVGLYSFFHDTLPPMREEHRAREASRRESLGWTLPWWMTGLWWVGAENLAPHCFRRHVDPDAAFGRAVVSMYRKMDR